jgi:ABC-2 type transport system ATP-binding protein
MPNILIKTDKLTREYRKSGGGTFYAVDNLDLDIYQGEIFAFLGVNGAGKTTTMKMLLGLTFPTSGSFEILGGDIGNPQIRAKIGYLPEESGIYPFLRVEDVLKFYARLFGGTRSWRKERVDWVIDFTGLNDKRHEQLRNLSKGLRQRVGIAQSLINNPELVFLDEPASGLDPVAIQDLRSMMGTLKSNGKTVFLNSHQLSEVELVADRVGMIKEGKLIKIGNLEDLVSGEGGVEIHITKLSRESAEKLIKQKFDLPPDAYDVISMNRDILVELNDEDLTDDVLSLLMNNGAKIISVKKKTTSLENIFSEVMRVEKQ